MGMKIYVDEAGCKRRLLDLQTIRTYLETNGHCLVANPEDADRILVSTCAFKQKEEDESVNRLRFFRKYGREVLVYGCLPDIAAERFREFADFHKIAPREIENFDKYFEHAAVSFAGVAEANLIGKQEVDLLKTVKRKLQQGTLLQPETISETAQAGLNRLKQLLCDPEESWFLFVCRGCRGLCSYCAIRRSVGSVKSKPVRMVLDEFRAGRTAGYYDFSILGDDPGCYGLDCGETFPELLRALLDECHSNESPEDLTKLRLHIKEIHPKFMIAYEDELVGHPAFRLVRSMLCPVQSGSDRILELMQREHSATAIREAMHKVRHENPAITLDTQIIVGFPGETDDDFHATLELVHSAGFDTVVVFPYHDKEGTISAEIAEKVPAATISKRMKEAFRFFKKEGIKAYYSCP